MGADFFEISLEFSRLNLRFSRKLRAGLMQSISLAIFKTETTFQSKTAGLDWAKA
jgi:hypothetical protein